MKRLVLLGLVLLGVVEAYPEVAYDFSIVETESQVAKRFEVSSPQLGPVTFWKREIDAPAHYDIFNSRGDWDGEAVACFFCMNLLYEWAVEIEIFNQEDMLVGSIEGHADGKAAARLDLYNARSQLVGIAYLNGECTEIKVQAPSGGGPIATFERVPSAEGPDSWTASVIDRRQMHPLILQTLAAWAIDRQDAFLRYEE